MFLENLVTDATDPARLGRFWEAALGGERLTDEPEGFETRLAMEGGPVLDLCFQRVGEARVDSPRLHVDLAAGADQSAEVERLLGLGARRLDIGQGDVPWVVLADPDANPFCVMEQRAVYTNTGPIAALALDSGSPERDAAFWSWLTGWRSTTTPAPSRPVSSSAEAPRSLHRGAHWRGVSTWTPRVTNSAYCPREGERWRRRHVTRPAWPSRPPTR